VPSFRLTQAVDAPATRTWQTVGNFADDSWMGLPMTVEGHGVGAMRSIRTPNATVVERCERLDDDALVVGYETVSGSAFPATDYHGTLTVRSTGDSSSEIEWAATYETDDPEAMEAGLGRAFAHGLGAMRDHIERAEA
jgi:hypothetical protein